MSKDAYYFSHDSNAQHDPKILRMMAKRGWKAYGLLGDPVSAGVYLYQLHAKDFVKTRKMVLLK